MPILIKKDKKAELAREQKQDSETELKEARKEVPELKKSDVKTQVLDTYQFTSRNIPITITINKHPDHFVPLYDIDIASISKNTEIILEKVRKELIEKVNIGMIEITEAKESGIIEEKFSKTINQLIKKYFPDADEKTIQFLTSYLVEKSLGLGPIEILMNDSHLEEIAINSAHEPVWVYHRKFGWLKTSISIPVEEQTRHYATMIGRKSGRQITLLEPLMDATSTSGDRVNATLIPISTYGNTITIRKFASKPWTITDFLSKKAISVQGAALIWLSIQYELSMLFTGGTGSGKTSMLNVASSFFPPNQRIISIEDTRELQLPKYLHWVPMLTRLPNPEGKGEVSMLDLLVNSLRMRPDRIAVGEIRRKKEAEVLFEAIHTGHSVYATVHANDTKETITRLTNPPIDISKTLIPAISVIVVMYRNRRTGDRRVFQISEIGDDASYNVLYQLDIKAGELKKVNNSQSLYTTLSVFTGMSKKDIDQDLEEKEMVLNWVVKQNINDVDEVGKIMAKYYTDKEQLMKLIKGK